MPILSQNTIYKPWESVVNHVHDCSGGWTVNSLYSRYCDNTIAAVDLSRTVVTMQSMGQRRSDQTATSVAGLFPILTSTTNLRVHTFNAASDPGNLDDVLVQITTYPVGTVDVTQIYEETATSNASNSENKDVAVAAYDTTKDLIIQNGFFDLSTDSGANIATEGWAIEKHNSTTVRFIVGERSTNNREYFYGCQLVRRLG